ncbi:MAG: hypothetical protein U1E76_18035 [Planctomycetota bacterium]
MVEVLLMAICTVARAGRAAGRRATERRCPGLDGLQSALFSPAKYGILPEPCRTSSLRKATASSSCGRSSPSSSARRRAGCCSMARVVTPGSLGLALTLFAALGLVGVV